MKKILTILALSLLVGGSVYASVWQYGSFKERAQQLAECGYFGYTGSYDQNTSKEVLDCLAPKTDGQLGYSVVTGYRTTLSTSMTSNQSTIPVSSLVTKDGHTMTMADLGTQVYLDIEPGSSREEIVRCTGISGSMFTGCTRGLAFYGTSTSAVAANAKAHNAGSAIVMSNVHYVYEEFLDKTSGKTATTLLYYSSTTDASLLTADGTALVSKNFVVNRNGYYEAPVANFAALPTGINAGEMRVTLDDGKVYTWSGTAWILAGAGGGAGIVYRTDTVVTSSAQLTYSLTSGSWPAKNYLTVYRNGSLLAEGAGNDYTAPTTGATITLLSAPVVGEVITLRVESIDFYNAAWGSVNADLLPDVDATHSIGSASKSFTNVSILGVNGGNSPTGSITAYVASTSPAGWFLCDGSYKSTSTYATLYSVIGDRFGAVSSTAGFKLPDLRGRQIIMASSTYATSSAIGQIGGEFTHSQTATELASHSHDLSIYDGTSGGSVPRGSNGGSVSGVPSTTLTGSSTPMNVTDPFLVLNYIIKY
jgi:microcystin-dependent protein